MKVGIAQISCTPGDVSANCARIVAFARKAHEAGCDLVVFPELTDTGYDLRTIRKSASSWMGLPLSLLRKTAAGLNLHMICGLTEKEAGTIYNSLAVINPQGEVIGRYRKTHLFASGTTDERRYFSAGSAFELVHIGVMRAGLAICYDLRFPEMSRALTLNGAETLLFSAAWPLARIQHWQALLTARAIENQCAVIGCNRVGTDAKLTFGGSSCILGPGGELIAQGSTDTEELVVGEINRTSIARARSAMQVFRDRRRDLYQL
jgi:predicted amidohydrolase